MKANPLETRRSFIATMAGAAGAGFMLSAFPRITPAIGAQEPKEAGVGPVEDLMREHGVLRRILLIYDELIRRIQAGREMPVQVIAGSAGIIRRFVENYHEKLEEDELFPRFEKTGKMIDLVRVLREQHQAGRNLTDIIMRSSAALASEKSRRELAEALRLFIRMYRPHAAREDTVLFPAFRSLVPAEEYEELGEEFEGKEEKLFGEGGFEKTVAEIDGFERTLGIQDLGKFTPRA